MTKINALWTNRLGCLLQAVPALVADTGIALAKGLDELQVRPPAGPAAELAVELGRVIDLAGERPYLLNLTSLAVVSLAEGHEIGRSPLAPCTEAVPLVQRLLCHADLLPPQTRELLDQVRDGIALDDGRGAFVKQVRRALRRAGNWRPGVVDVDRKGRFRLGGRQLAYEHDEDLGDGTKVEVRRRFSVRNAEGRLFLLLAAGKAIATPPRSALSRVRRTVADTTRDGVQLVHSGDRARFSPPLELTPRAASWLRRIGSVKAKVRVSRGRVRRA